MTLRFWAEGAGGSRAGALLTRDDAATSVENGDGVHVDLGAMRRLEGGGVCEKLGDDGPTAIEDGHRLHVDLNVGVVRGWGERSCQGLPEPCRSGCGQGMGVGRVQGTGRGIKGG